MNVQESLSLARKTTMRIGGTARYYVELAGKSDVNEAYIFAAEKQLPLIPLGGGSNTIFADGNVAAVICKITAKDVQIADDSVTVESGQILAVLINTLAEAGLDLSALTGIPGSVGGAVFGNAGQGAGGIWIDSFIESVTVFVGGEWKTMTKEDCHFRYRESWFKDQANEATDNAGRPLIWSVQLKVPRGETTEIKAEVERLLQKRIETQPHVKTAGSCFKSLPDGTPAWKLIDAAGLRGTQRGGIQISEKHANFLLNVENGSFADVVAVTNEVKHAVPQIAGVEMRLYGENGELVQ